MTPIIPCVDLSCEYHPTYLCDKVLVIVLFLQLVPNQKRIHIVRTRGGNKKYRALRLDSGNYSWGSEGVCKGVGVGGGVGGLVSVCRGIDWVCWHVCVWCKS